MKALPSTKLRHCVPLLLSCLLLLSSGCGGDDGDGKDTSEPVGTEAFTPHENGRSWTFALTQDGVASGQFVAVVDGNRTVGGVQTQQLRLEGQPGTGAVWSRINSSGVAIQEAGNQENSLVFSPLLEVLPFPFKLGDTFQTEATIPVDILQLQGRATTKVAGYGSVTAGGQSYPNAFRLESEVSIGIGQLSLQGALKFWLVSGVGPVRVEAVIPENPVFSFDGVFALELLESSAP